MSLLRRSTLLVGLGLALLLMSVSWASPSCGGENTTPTTGAPITTTSTSVATSTTQAAATTTTTGVKTCEITIDSVSASTDFVDADNEVYNAESGHVFLVLETTLRRTASAYGVPFEVNEADMTAVDAAGNTYQCVGDKQVGRGWQLGSTNEITVFAGDFSQEVELELGLVYTVKETSIDQAFTLQYANAPPVFFTVAEVTSITEPVSLNEWDDTAEVGGLRITVGEPIREKRLHAEDADGRRQDATYKVIVAQVILESVTDTPHIYAASCFLLTDDQGGTYLGGDDDPAYLSDRTPMRSGYLDPEKTITRWLAFVVPIDASAESISYSQDGSFGGNIHAVWSATAPSPSTTLHNGAITSTEATETLTLDEASSALLEARPFVHSTEGFAVRAPRGWTVEENPASGGAALMLSPHSDQTAGSDGFCSSISFTTKDAAGMDLDRTVKAALETASDIYTFTDGPRKVSVEGTPAYISTAEFADGKTMVTILTLVMVKGTTSYWIEAFTLSSNWERDKPSLLASLLSFTLTP